MLLYFRFVYFITHIVILKNIGDFVCSRHSTSSIHRVYKPSIVSKLAFAPSNHQTA